MRAGDFARQWQDAWNRHDIEAVLGLFHDDVLFTSPLAVKIDPDSGGILKGKEALRRYWSAAIAKVPDLRFEVTSLFEGMECLLIGFRNEAGMDRFEVLRFRDGLVIEGHGTYPAAMAA
jgi:ketosteroid isomerase-like protein